MDYSLWASFLSLTALEIVLGIDNVVFIALVVGHLPKAQQQRARVIGLTLAMVFRIVMLFGIAWIIGMKEPLLHVFGLSFSGKDLMMLGGGLFLIYKATTSIGEEFTEEIHSSATKSFSGGFTFTILQIVVLDIIFSFDSVITAVGLTDHIYTIIAAMSVAMVIMLVLSGYIADFISANPTIKMLALSFIMMIGLFLVAEGLGFHIPKGYIYFAMAFSLAIEVMNIRVRKKKNP